jgi:hypothetical protein
MGGLLGTSTEGKGRNELGLGVEGQPEPGDPVAAAQASPDLIELEGIVNLRLRGCRCGHLTPDL